jgi:putative addiction module killer protein
MFTVEMTDEYLLWQARLNDKQRLLVDARIERLKNFGHLGVYKHIEGPLIELKWKQSLRVYLARTEDRKFVLLWGGTKNGQDRDIKKAKNLLSL